MEAWEAVGPVRSSEQCEGPDICHVVRRFVVMSCVLGAVGLPLSLTININGRDVVFLKPSVTWSLDAYGSLLVPSAVH